MVTNVEFNFDFGSPTSYLAHKRLLQLKEKYPVNVVYKPVLLGAILKASHNTSPAMIPAKGRYMMAHDLPRFAARYGVDFSMNPHFPINTLALMRGAHAAMTLECFSTYVDVVFEALWVNGHNLGDQNVIADVLATNDLDATELLSLAGSDAIKQSLLAGTNQAIDKGVFGAPTMFIDGEMYFGQDRLDFVEEALIKKSS